MQGLIERVLPCRGGLKRPHSGFDCGPFFVYKQPQAINLGWGQATVWTCALNRNGISLPYFFLTPEAAKAFAEDIAALMDWGAVEAEAAKESHMAVWVDRPAYHQQQQVQSAARRRGAFYC